MVAGGRAERNALCRTRLLPALAPTGSGVGGRAGGDRIGSGKKFSGTARREGFAADEIRR